MISLQYIGLENVLIIHYCVQCQLCYDIMFDAIWYVTVQVMFSCFI